MSSKYDGVQTQQFAQVGIWQCIFTQTHTYIINRIDDANRHIIENNFNEYVSKIEIYIIHIFPCISTDTFFYGNTLRISY